MAIDGVDASLPIVRDAKYKGKGGSKARDSKSPSRDKFEKPRAQTVPERRKDFNGLKGGTMSRSPSPRTKRSRRAQEDKDLDKKSRDWDHGRSKGRDNDADRYMSRDRDKGRERGKIRDRDRVTDSRTSSRNTDRLRDRRGRDNARENSPVRSPVRTRQERSLSPRNTRSRRPLSLPRSSPRHRGSKRGPHGPENTATAARDEGTTERGKERHRDDHEMDGDHEDSLARMKAAEVALEAKEKEKPSFEYSGKLAAETNKVKGVTLQFTEPPESRKPTTRWRLYVFKDGEPLNDPLYIHRQTCYLFGRERRVADVPTDHPSCSKQHAVIQYRLTEKEDPDGTVSNKVRPYVMDLGSTNGTLLNGERLESQRYYEMFEKDTIKFGNSSREYVLLHEHSVG